jgi:predicted alpha-1,6-mannanase (GH76 family)
VIAYTERTGDDTYRPVIGRTFTGARRRHSNFLNSFYDDNGWWGLAWLAAYDLTGNARYLDAARTIFANMLTGWDDTCAGGVWWNTDRRYKNAITNELFLALAARLHLRCSSDGADYLDWAHRAWEWFDGRGLIGATGLINDGLTSACENNGGATWSYNQGVILGGLAAMYGITGDAAYLNRGEAIADAALRLLTTDSSAGTPGILVDRNEGAPARRNRDGPQFKGVFMRNLYDFYLQRPRPHYQQFICSNARSIWENNRNQKNQFGLRWAGPFDQADACRQSSALDALNAAVPFATR